MTPTRSLVPFAGFAFAIALLVETVFGPGGANSNDPASKIAAYYANNGSGDIFTDYVSIFAAASLLVVLCAVAARTGGTVGSFLLVAAGAGAVLEIAATAIEMALAANVHEHAPPTTTAALYQVASRLFFTATLALGGAVALTAVGETRNWLAWLARITGGLLVLAGLGAVHPHGRLAVLLLPAWALLVVWSVGWSIAALRTDFRSARPLA